MLNLNKKSYFDNSCMTRINHSILLTIAIVSFTLLLSSCSGIGETATTPTSSPVSGDNTILNTLAPTETPGDTVSAKYGYLDEYKGEWYGYGTDSTEAQTSAIQLVFLENDQLRLGDEAFTLVDKYTAESVNDYFDSSNNKMKTLLEFGKDSNGELALASYGIRQTDRKQYTQTMCYYRQAHRSNYQDFVQHGQEINVTDSNELSKRSKEFISRAHAIEEYDKTHLQTATTQRDMNVESKKIYEQWDELLNDVYQYLKSIKPESEFNAIKTDEINWIKKKEDAVRNASVEYAGGSMEAMVQNSTAADLTKDRCYYLISLIDEKH